MVVVGYNMKTIQTKSGEVLLVKVPEDARNFWLNFDEVCFKKDKGFGSIKRSDCFHENYQDTLSYTHKIVGKFSELKDKSFEEFVFQWGQNMPRDIVDFSILGYSDIVKIDKNHNLCYKDYLDNFNNNYTLTSKESFQTLCRSQGIEDNLDNYLIIKKI